MALDPTGNFAYVTNRESGDISGYMIDATTGTLTQIPGSPFPAGARPIPMSVDPTGKFAYVGNYDSGNVSGYMIDGTTGALTPMLSPGDR